MTKCPICDSTSTLKIPFRHDVQTLSILERHNKTSSYSWHLCKNCGNGFPSEQPELSLLSEIWSLNREQNSPSAKSEFVRRIEISKKGALRNLKIYGGLLGGKTGRFLDIACGYGETVRAFADAGWEAFGIDTDANTKDHHEHIGINTEISPVEKVTFTGKFDLIHISHAIYFITDPMHFIQVAKSLLKEGGYFCVSISDFMSSLDPGLPQYAHTFYPTRKSMLKALFIAGFDVKHIKTYRGTIYLLAQKTNQQRTSPKLCSQMIYLGWKTKELRHRYIGSVVLRSLSTIKKLLMK